MVRVFDPTRNDPTVILIRTIQDFVYRKTNALSFNEIKKAIDNFLSQNQYSKMFEEYQKKLVEFPDIALKNNCAKEHFFWKRKKEVFHEFKSVYEPENNKIIVCTNYITNFMELKENLDREISMAYDYNIRKQNFKQDSDFACSLIRSCHLQLKNYSLDSELTKEMTKLCARNLFKVFFFKKTYFRLFILL